MGLIRRRETTVRNQFMLRNTPEDDRMIYKVQIIFPQSPSLLTHFLHFCLRRYMAVALNSWPKCGSSSYTLSFSSSSAKRNHLGGGGGYKCGFKSGLQGKRGRTNSKCRHLRIKWWIASSGKVKTPDKCNSWKQVHNQFIATRAGIKNS
jgi:hypothetical protein